MRKLKVVQLHEKEEKARHDALVDEALSPSKITSTEMLEELSSNELNELRQQVFKDHEITQIRAQRTSERAAIVKESVEYQLNLAQNLLNNYNNEVN